VSKENSRPRKSSYDVIVIGGGPAGSTAATLVARAGHDVLLLDRERFPRYRLGESLMPATYWTLSRLGVLDKVKNSGFPRKYSVQFFSKSGRSGTPFYFRDTEPHDSSQTWQVDRAGFDQMLLDNAREAGVEVCQRANVKDVLFEGDRATGVDVELNGEQRSQPRATVIVDATGQTALISRKLKLKQVDPKLRHASLYTRYRGAVRDAGIDEGATLIMHTREERSWFWYIPLPDDQVSVGVVGPIDYLITRREGNPRQIFDDEVALCPALEARIRGAERLMEVGAIRDFSYISKRIAGNGWVLAGDAFGFLDPIYSSGVFLALKSAEDAADSINEALERRDFSAEQLGRHGDAYLAGMEAMRKLVYAYYDSSFSFAVFFKRFPQCREDVVNLLIGNVFRKPPGELFESMSEMCELPEARTLTPVEVRR
jgi:flavin-dependent dehydrogenase